MYSFVKEIESTLPKIFNCERATLVLVNRWKQYLFRIVRDPVTGIDDLEMYEMTDGFSGFITIAGHMIQTEDTYMDHRFC
jgi:hypothetical protein